MIEKPKPSLSFGGYLDDYFLPHFTSKNKSAWKSMYIIKIFRGVFDNRELSGIKPVEVERAVLSAASHLSSSSFNNFISTIHRIFQYAVEIELLIANPVKIKKSRKDNTRKRFLTVEERTALLDACKKSDAKYLYDMVCISLYAGLRLNEVKHLSPEDIRDGCIYISPDISKNKKNREIPLTPKLTDILAHTSYDFNHDIKKSFATAVRRAGLTGIRFHDMRRTFGSMLAQAGVPIFDISKLMGHASPTLTAKVYAHLLPDNLTSAVSKLPAV
jgi:integrase